MSYKHGIEWLNILNRFEKILDSPLSIVNVIQEDRIVIPLPNGIAEDSKMSLVDLVTDACKDQVSKEIEQVGNELLDYEEEFIKNTVDQIILATNDDLQRALNYLEDIKHRIYEELNL